ncbi:MAG: hypothetical protein HW413_2270 [Thermoleophilia bacterium]|nr:hypothetical protein [Thermoleophilia bacterium]
MAGAQQLVHAVGAPSLIGTRGVASGSRYDTAG